MTYDRCARHDLYQDTHKEKERETYGKRKRKRGRYVAADKNHVACMSLPFSSCKLLLIALQGTISLAGQQQQNVAYYVAATAIKRHITANKRVSQLSETIISNNHKGNAIVVFF